MANYPVSNIDQILSNQSQKEVTANENFDAASPAMGFGRQASTTVGLTFGYYGATVNVAGALTQIPNDTLALTGSATNYVKMTGAGVVNFTTSPPSGWPDLTGGDIALWEIVTSSTVITDATDWRQTTLGTPAVESMIIACSDESTPLTASTAKAKFRMPYAFTVTAVRASLTTAQASGSTFTVDINEGASSILSTKLTIDNTEKTSKTAAAAAVISDASIADDAEMSIDIDTIGDGTASGLKVVIIGHR